MTDEDGPTDGPLLASAVEIAAKATGIRPDQARKAVEAYRAACAEIGEEPAWRAVMHVSGAGFGVHTYEAPGTEVRLQIETFGKKGREKGYWLERKWFETYAEARAVELTAEARPGPYGVEE